MLDKQLKVFSTLVHNEDLQKYAGDAFLNFIKAVTFNDVGAGVKTLDDVRKILVHIPTVLFWDKMKRYLYGTFRNFSDQIKLAEKFHDDNPKYQKFVKKQIQLINELDDDEKIDYFAQLTRSFLMTGLEEILFFKLTKFLNICTPYELAFLKSVDYNYSSTNNVIISSLYQYGLFVQKTDHKNNVRYALSDFAKSLKQNCLNFDDGIGGATRLVSYNQIAPLEIMEPMSLQDLEDIIQDQTIILDGGSASENIE